MVEDAPNRGASTFLLEPSVRPEIDAFEHERAQGEHGAADLLALHDVAGSLRALDEIVHERIDALGASLAEESDLINVIGKNMLRATTREMADRRTGQSLDITLKVNLSARQLEDPHLVAAVRDALATTGLPPSALCLEVTESALMRDEEAAAEVLASLRALGVLLAIDDFGTGYSSLAQLRRLTLDTLKIDRSFITGIAESRDAAAIVTSIIAMAHAVDLTVVAEGVETEAQLEKLRELECDQAQGYHLGRPSAAAELFGQ